MSKFKKKIEKIKNNKKDYCKKKGSLVEKSKKNS